MRTLDPAWSYASFSRKAKLGAPNAFQRVAFEDYGISEETARKFALAMGLTAAERHYFVCISQWGQLHGTDPKTQTQIDKWENKICRAIKRHRSASVAANNFLYIRSPGVVALRELLLCQVVPLSAAQLGQALVPQMDESEVAASLETLRALGLVRYESGGWKNTGQSVDTGDVSIDPAVRSFHRQSIQILETGLDNFPVDERMYGNFVAAVSQEQKKWLMGKLQEIQHELFNRAVTDEESPNEVVMIGHYLVPLSRRVEESETME